MSWTRLIKNRMLLPLLVSLLLHAGILLLIHTAGPVQRSVEYHEAGPALTTYVQLHRLQPITDRVPEKAVQASVPEVERAASTGQEKIVQASVPEMEPAAGRTNETAAAARTHDAAAPAGSRESTEQPVNGNHPAVGHGSSRVSSGEAASEPSPAVIIEENLQRLIREMIEERKRYPDAARRRGEEGAVELRLAVDPGGRLQDCTLYRPSGSTILDRDAVRLVQSIFPIDASIDRELSTVVRIDYSLQ